MQGRFLVKFVLSASKISLRNEFKGTGLGRRSPPQRCFSTVAQGCLIGVKDLFMGIQEGTGERDTLATIMHKRFVLCSRKDGSVIFAGTILSDARNAVKAEYPSRVSPLWLKTKRITESPSDSLPIPGLVQAWAYVPASGSTPFNARASSERNQSENHCAVKQTDRIPANSSRSYSKQSVHL